MYFIQPDLIDDKTQKKAVKYKKENKKEILIYPKEIAENIFNYFSSETNIITSPFCAIIAFQA